MKHIRYAAGCTLLHRRRNEDILKELKVDPTRIL
jgi:hypothetical protein